MKEIDLPEYFHILNRGTEKINIFIDENDFLKFLGYLEKYSSTTSVGIISYCLNPNHFHLILEERIDKHVAKLMQLLSTAYTMYFNTKYSRNGVLFQGHYKSIEIENNEDLLWVFGYVTLNNYIHGLIDDPFGYKWCAVYEYIQEPRLCSTQVISDQFSNTDYLKTFLLDAGQCQREKKVEKYLLEDLV